MKRLTALLLVLLVAALSLAALDFTSIDSLYDRDIDDQRVYDTLQEMLSKATTKEDKAEVLWRLSRVCVDLGDGLDDDEKTARIAIYEKGEAFAKQSIEANPNPMAYLWKCCNIGRWGQTKGVLNSLFKVDPMKADLKVVTDQFNCVDSSEAWYTLAVLYDSVPGMFGGDTNMAISYARVACDTIPGNKIYGGTYKALAEMLYKRNWTAKKRSTEIAKFQTKWNKETSSNFTKYGYYEGKDGASGLTLWSKAKIGQMSDRQEALIVLKYAQAVYKAASYHTESDEDNYEDIQELIEEWSK